MIHVAKKSETKKGNISKIETKTELPITAAPKTNSISKIQGFLEKRDLSYEVLDDQTLVVPYEIDGKLFKPTVSLNDKWIVVSSLIIKNEDLPQGIDDEYKLQLFRKLLLAIHDLPEINYDIDDQDNIHVSADMRYDITDNENFFSEFLAIPYGIKYFLEKIAPSMDPPIDVHGFE